MDRAIRFGQQGMDDEAKPSLWSHVAVQHTLPEHVSRTSASHARHLPVRNGTQELRRIR